MIAPKTVAGTAGSSVGSQLAAVVIWAVHQFFKVDIPPEVAVALAGLIIAPFTFFAAYYAPHTSQVQQQPKPTPTPTP